MSSPGDLEKALIEPVPQGSLLLVVLLVLMLAAASWGWFGTVKLRVETQGFLELDPTAALGYSAITYAAQGDGYRLRVGDEGSLSLATLQGATAGRLRVSVQAISLRPVKRDGFDGFWVPVKLDISDQWIGDVPEDVRSVLGDGVPVASQLIIGNDRPFSILMPVLARSNDR